MAETSTRVIRRRNRGPAWPAPSTGGTTAATPTEDRALRGVVRDHLLEALRDGQLPPGARVHETALAQALSVSLAPVREALFKLAEQGVLEHRPRRGFFVATLGESEVHEIFTLRALLEGFAARLIAEQTQLSPDLPKEALARRESVLEALRQLKPLIEEGLRSARAGDTPGVREVNSRFHDELFGIAGHVMLRRMWGSLAPTTWLLTPGAKFEPMTPEAVQDWGERHYRLLEVLASGDPDAAEREAATHVRGAGVERRRRARDVAARAGDVKVPRLS